MNAAERRCPQHLDWIRALPCCIGDCGYRWPRCAHHVRDMTGGGMGLKPADRWTVPLCHGHHMEGHTSGWRTFQVSHGINLRWLAEQLASLSPHLGPPNPPCTEPGGVIARP